ncbi:MAG: M3 family oligoendopeptidase [Candidatus Bathyarchaeota archaeon]|nr:M3 family oligoendopeptidase [Candidatus Bathyarchaeota archaeon]
MFEDEMAWDLSQLVRSTDPAVIKDELSSRAAEAEEFRRKHHREITSLDAQGLKDFLEEKDAFTLKCEGVIKYCYLLYSADSTNSVAKELHEAVRKAEVKIEKALTFIDIKLGELLAKKPSLVQEPLLKEYKHFLEKILRRVPHMLSEVEEQLIITKDKNGVFAWQILQSDWLTTRTFEIEIDGEKKSLPYGKIVGLYQSPNRDLRKRANQAVYENLGRDEILWASAIRAVCDDHLQLCKIREYSTPMSQSLIANDVDQQTIDSLLKTITRNVDLYQRYLKLKAKLMGVEKLSNYDLAAPLPETPEMKYSWKDAREEVVDAYTEFDKEVGDWVDEMFETRHIDGEVRNGKESGAWCASWINGKSAYILQSFNEKIGDVYTQAHELGHAIHAYLGTRSQKPSNLEIGSCVAETGSVFGELLLTERLLKKAKTKEEKQAILANVWDEFGMAAFQVSARVFFEQSMYDAISQGRFLDGENIAKLWIKARSKIYGNSVDWLDVMKWEWTMKVHYYMANYRFYNYPYVYANLFVFALYKLYKEEGKAFIPKLKRILAAGSSRSPRDLAAELGFDIREESFWEKGMEQAREFIDLLEKTT